MVRIGDVEIVTQGRQALIAGEIIGIAVDVVAIQRQRRLDRIVLNRI